MTTAARDLVEVGAIALSTADPDERPLPDGVEMAPFYRGLCAAALVATFRKLAEDGPTEAMLDADRRGLHTRSELEVICILISRALLRELEEMTL